MDNLQINKVTGNSQRRLPNEEECFKQSPLSSKADGQHLFRLPCNRPPPGNNNRGFKDFLRDVSKCCLG